MAGVSYLILCYILQCIKCFSFFFFLKDRVYIALAVLKLCVDQAGLIQRNVSWVVGLKVCTITPSFHEVLLNILVIKFTNDG